LAERKAREAETRLEERRELGRLVEQCIEEERRMIAHELHDEFSQSVTAIRSLALAIGAQAGAHDSRTAETAHLIAAEAARLYDAMHGLIPRLAPLIFDTLGLGETLENLCRDSRRRYPAVELDLRYGLNADLGDSVKLVIFRIVQEGIINAVRHAQPSRIDICVESGVGSDVGSDVASDVASGVASGVKPDAARILVSVADDGVGLPADWARPGRFGLRGLAERVGGLGGTLSVANRPSRGVLLRAEIPLTAAMPFAASGGVDGVDGRGRVEAVDSVDTVDTVDTVDRVDRVDRIGAPMAVRS
jgi:two-component system sensor histidine kinase UhpB